MKLSNHFKIIICLLGVCACSFLTLEAGAHEKIDNMMMLYDLQKYIHVEDNVVKARKTASELVSRISDKSELHAILTPLVQKIGAISKEPDESIRFATGTKDEIYCKDVGLVHLLARHNNGTTSEVRIISSNRKLSGGYSIPISGDWVYEFNSSYRESIRSESWMVKSTPNSYEITEVRQNKNGDFDEGHWMAEWNKEGPATLKAKTKGEMEEPVPMYMANAYHNWGTYDMGFKINFKVGYKDTIFGKCNGLVNTIWQKTRRSVGERLEQISYSDSSGKKHTYNDCFKVHSVIELDKLEPFKTGTYNIEQAP